MHKKRILVICNSFWPDIDPRSFRATELVKELCRQSHEVWVMKPNITESQSHFAREHGFQFIDLGTFNGEPLVKSKSRVGQLVGRLVNRVAQLFFEFPFIKLYFLVRKSIRSTKQKFDLCISIAVPYPIHWGTAAGLEKNKITNTWIADCGDPFMGDESDSFRHPFYFKYIEKHFCRRADYLTVPTSKSYKGYYEEFWHKIKVIPQGFDFSEVVLANERHEYPCPAFGYAGGVIPNYREPFDFLEYLCNVEYDFRMVIFSLNKNYFEPYKEKLGDKLFLNEPTDRLKVLHEFSRLDFVINFNNKGSKQTASKLIDYHIIQKPILNIDFRSFDAYEFERFYKGNYSNQFKIENPDQYRIQNVTKNFINLCK
jgi:hypothetical protein